MKCIQCLRGLNMEIDNEEGMGGCPAGKAKAEGARRCSRCQLIQTYNVAQ